MKKFLLALLTLASSSIVFSQNSIPVGQSSNAYSMLRTSQNQIFIDPSLNTVGFIYRHNIALYGGGTSENGHLRYSISVDGGNSWETELGVLNSTYTRPARYPQSWLYNPNGNTDPFAAYMVWAGPTIPSNFDGLVAGTAQIDTANPVTTTENYIFQNSSTLIPGGLCESTSGTFWMVENTSLNDTTYLDSLNVYKGTYSSGNVNWVKHTVLYSPHSTAFDGNVHLSGPNIAFSPDGSTGYVVFLGDINAPDSTYNPIYYKSTDGGTTWSGATELIIDNIAGVGDSIKQFLFDTGTAIESASEVSCAFECDITVDSLNNLHIFTTLCAVERRDTLGAVTGAKSYVVYSGYPKNAVDIYTNDGGTTWTSFYVSQVNEFRTSVPSTPSALGVDNYPQISRSKDGSIMFYSWSDTDTLIHTGATTNEAPNTFIAGWNMNNNKRTCWKQISGVSNEDFVITPTMGPFVLEDNNGGPQWTLPIITQDVPVDALNPTNYYYVGKGAKFCDEDFRDPATVDLSWSFSGQCYQYNSCFSIGIEEYESNRFNLYPNPASTMLNIDTKGLVNVTGFSIVNQMGQIMKVMTLNDPASTIQIDIAGLANGMYSLHLSANGKSYSKKFTVIK